MGIQGLGCSPLKGGAQCGSSVDVLERRDEVMGVEIEAELRGLSYGAREMAVAQWVTRKPNDS